MSIYFVALQVACVMTIWSQLQPEYAANMWNEALNKRLGTKVCGNLVSCSNTVIHTYTHTLEKGEIIISGSENVL